MRSILTLLFVFVCALTLFGQSKSALPIRITEPAASRTATVKLTAAKIEDLAALGKVWGLLKYHHPGVALGSYNWDAELLRVMPDIMAAGSAMERNAILSQWIDGMGNFLLSNGIPPVPGTKLEADTLWIKPATFGPRLAKQLTLVKNAQRTGQHWYMSFTPFVGNPIFQNEDAYAAMTYPDLPYRLLGLYRYWNIIQYYSPNRHLMGENWNAVMTEYIPRFVNAANELEYKKTAQSLIGRIHDTHANVWGNDAALNQDKGLRAASLRTRFVEGKAVVTEYWNKTGAQTGLIPGDVIESVNGTSVEDLVSQRLEYYPASNYPTKLRDIGVHLLRTNANTINVVYRRNGVSTPATLETYPWETTINLNYVYHLPVQRFRYVTPNIAYLYPGSLTEGEIDTYIPQMNGSRGLIIDWRCYPSTFDTITVLGNYLLDEVKPFARFTKGNNIVPGRFTYAGESTIGGSGPAYTGKVVILVNELSQSSAEFHSMAFRAVPGAIVIGSTTAGADGNISYFYLPGNVRTAISGIGVYYPDGTETQRVGIVPDILKEPTIQGIRDGRDEVLERAIEYINSN